MDAWEVISRSKHCGAFLFLTDPSLSGELIELVRAERVRSAQLSPDGRWLVYAVTFSGDPEQDGIWLLDTASQEKRRLEFFGAYRWRDPGRLIFVPLDLSKTTHIFWQIDVATGLVEPLTSSESSSVENRWRRLERVAGREESRFRLCLRPEFVAARAALGREVYPSPAGSAGLRKTVSLDPIPILLSTSIRPPCCWITWRAMDNPRPTPRNK